MPEELGEWDKEVGSGRQEGGRNGVPLYTSRPITQSLSQGSPECPSTSQRRDTVKGLCVEGLG